MKMLNISDLAVLTGHHRMTIVRKLRELKHTDGDQNQKLYDSEKALRLIFPNGWADVAKREGFELPPEPQKK